MILKVIWVNWLYCHYENLSSSIHQLPKENLLVCSDVRVSGSSLRSSTMDAFVDLRLKILCEGILVLNTDCNLNPLSPSCLFAKGYHRSSCPTCGPCKSERKKIESFGRCTFGSYPDRVFCPKRSCASLEHLLISTNCSFSRVARALNRTSTRDSAAKDM